MCVPAKRVSGLNPSPIRLRRLPVNPNPLWVCNDISINVLFGITKSSYEYNDIVVLVDNYSEIHHLAAVPDTISIVGTAKLFIDRVIRRHGLPVVIASDPDSLLTGMFKSFCLS